MAEDFIPLSVPNIGASEREVVDATLRDGWVSTSGPAVRKFEEAMAAYTGVAYAVALNSGTAALHLALVALGVERGDMVIVPNLTFAATLNALHYVGARPVLVDIVPESLQMDPALVAEFLATACVFRDGATYHRESGARVRALMPVHVLGYPCDLPRLLELSRNYGIPLIEDAAAAIGSRLEGKHLGSFGLMGVLSFNGNKILTTGGGGMVITNDARLAGHVRHLAHQAKSFPDEYIHDIVGYNYGMTNLSAALGLAQLERLEGFLERKREIHAFYKAAFAGHAHIRLHDPIGLGATPNHWLETIFTPKARLLEVHLRENGIQARKLWVPMNRLPMQADAIYLSRADHSHGAYERSLCLPCSSGVKEGELEKVAAVVNQFAG